MSLVRALRASPDPAAIDQRVFLNNVSWSQFEQLLVIRGDKAGPRATYVDGTLELMSPSRDHEMRATMIGRLLEAYAEELGVDLNGFGSWTLKNKSVERGIEPDECYSVGAPKKDLPDLAIEVIWTHGGLDKLEVYRGLGVPEIWVWKDDRIDVHVLVAGGYEKREKSLLLPDLDLRNLERFITAERQTDAVRAFRATIKRT